MHTDYLFYIFDAENTQKKQEKYERSVETNLSA